MKNQRIETVLEALSKSNFRSKFCLKEKDKEYVAEKGLDINLIAEITGLPKKKILSL